MPPNTIAKVARGPIRTVGHHRLGNKQIFLPNFTLTLLNTPHLSPSFASFIVPLNINKLDLRDYLWHAYGVQVRGVRSYIQQQKVRQDKPGVTRVSPRKWYRPRAIKKMLVEMEKPFVWPKTPENLEDWDKSAYDAAKEGQQAESETIQPDFREQPTRERGSIAEQARKLIKGKATWIPNNAGAIKWEDDGEAVEVEQDFGPPDDGKKA
ncbi:related to ribosomal protein [Rhynchosporium agropyri]|uniref:Large ribosomal subunit protein uL23m n=1 Tax=Rhynchosporium agropyri TaxID=914238 RepID=A0A1E1KE36_9HELO|nr:related to ribosomal protein [Rhynchosporium agropyri]